MRRVFQEVAFHLIAVGLVSTVVVTMTLAAVLECRATDTQWDNLMASR